MKTSFPKKIKERNDIRKYDKANGSAYEFTQSDERVCKVAAMRVRTAANKKAREEKEEQEFVVLNLK